MLKWVRKINDKDMNITVGVVPQDIGLRAYRGLSLIDTHH